MRGCFCSCGLCRGCGRFSARIINDKPSQSRNMATMHAIDFKIFGDDMQYVEVELDPLEAAVAEAGGMMYMEYDIRYVGKIKTAFFGGEGLFFATLRGPGRIWLQSLPLSRLAGRITAASPQTGPGGREEGSILGGPGRLIDGGNSYALPPRPLPPPPAGAG